MSKYTSAANRRSIPNQQGPHPIWSALGCLMLIVVPAMSIAGAVMTIQTGLAAGWPIPPQLLRPIFLPGWLVRYLPGLASLLRPAISVDNLMAYAAVSIVYIIVLGGIVSIVYAALYRFTGPPKYGPMDAPPDRYRRSTKKSR